MDELILKINEQLANLDFEIPSSPSTKFYENEILKAHKHPILAGGKRIRPLLTLLTAGSFGGEEAITTAISSALAIELIHTYTLVHDDLPCMDNDDLRRGLPTTHKIFGEAKALLVGDGLLAQAFFKASQTIWPKNENFTKEIIEILAQASCPRGVIWGQWLDLSLTGQEETTWEQMEIVHKFKTGVILGASLELGFICGISHLEIPLKQNRIVQLREKIKSAGILIGLAFQIIDDILDTTKTSEELGKTAGKDENQNKFTAVRLLGMEKAKELSLQYTNQAKGILKEILNEFNHLQKGKERQKYIDFLDDIIGFLLARPN